MDWLSETNFNGIEAKKMLLDINSCFATIEQQANPLLQGKAVVVAAYGNDNGCILAASREAKLLGIKTGLQIKAAKKIFPQIIILTPDPTKYRHVHNELRKIIEEHSPNIEAKSIDEFSVDFTGIQANPWEEAIKIKAEIKEKVGEWVTVSIGIGPNFFLAKLASNLQKPDGLVQIDKTNFKEIYQKIRTIDLPGIGFKSSCKLTVHGIESGMDFYNCSRQRLRSIFHSVWADYWYWRLRGWEIDDKKRALKKTFGAIISLKIPAKNRQELAAIYFQLCSKVGRRCKRQNQGARGIIWWARGENQEIEGRYHGEEVLRNGWEIFEKIYPRIEEFDDRIKKAVLVIYDLNSRVWQKDIFGQRENNLKKSEIAVRINEKFGEGTIIPGNILVAQRVADFIGFGNLE